MTTPPRPEFSEAKFSEARDLMQRLLRVRPFLRGPDAVLAFRDAVRNPQRLWALYFLLLAETDLVRELLPELIVAALYHRDALLVRGIVGRLPRSVLQSELPPLVESRLVNADDDEFRRLAEMLDHLGLTPELMQLIAVAKESDDPNIREIAEDYEW